MRRTSRRIVVGVGMAAAGAYLLAGPGTSCSSYVGETLFTTTDLCFIFDCQNGILGGTIDPCAGLQDGDQSGEQPLFTDCPGFQAP